MEFYKYHGTGNDFIILDARGKGPFLSRLEIEALCHRHNGIGADGIIFSCDPGDGADGEMRIFNADGSEAEMCGNGIRCLAKYLYEKARIHKEEMLIETRAGTKALKLTVSDGLVTEIEVDMGLPVFSNSGGRGDASGRPGEASIILETGDEMPAICLSMGNPHCVIFVDDVDEAEVDRLGPLIERHSLFPSRTNVEFAQLVSPGHLRLRVWERGVGETAACGTGACAAFVAAMNSGGAERAILISLRGGDLRIRADDSGHVHMAGPAVEVYAGQLNANWKDIQD